MRWLSRRAGSSDKQLSRARFITSLSIRLRLCDYCLMCTLLGSCAVQSVTWFNESALVSLSTTGFESTWQRLGYLKSLQQALVMSKAIRSGGLEYCTYSCEVLVLLFNLYIFFYSILYSTTIQWQIFYFWIPLYLFDNFSYFYDAGDNICASFMFVHVSLQLNVTKLRLLFVVQPWLQNDNKLALILMNPWVYIQIPSLPY